MCKHKSKILTCPECKECFCTRCIQLEVHNCPGLTDKIKSSKELLAQKLVKVEAPKISSF